MAGGAAARVAMVVVVKVVVKVEVKVEVVKEEVATVEVARVDGNTSIRTQCIQCIPSAQNLHMPTSS